MKNRTSVNFFSPIMCYTLLNTRWTTDFNMCESAMVLLVNGASSKSEQGIEDWLWI